MAARVEQLGHKPRDLQLKATNRESLHSLHRTSNKPVPHVTAQQKALHLYPQRLRNRQMRSMECFPKCVAQDMRPLTTLTIAAHIDVLLAATDISTEAAATHDFFPFLPREAVGDVRPGC